MDQLTVKDLCLELSRLVAQGHGDKKVVLSNDLEGNGLHGCYYSCTSDPTDVKDIIDSSWLYDSDETNPNNIVIIG